jgi:hypothetical protein
MNYLRLAVAIGIGLGAGWIGYQVGRGVSTKEIHDADKQLIDSANQDALDARTELQAVKDEDARQAKIRAKAKELADGIYKDLQSDATKTAQQLNAARTRIKELQGHDKPSADWLSTPIPAAVRDSVCQSSGEACGSLR